MPEPSDITRRCPDCGTLTPAHHCPRDGTQTLRPGRPTRDALGYRAGEVLGGRYRIGHTIGRGGFGAVYAGEHTGTHQPVALKVLTLDPETAGEDVTRRFFKEAQITAQLKAQNTVRLFDVGQDDAGPLYLVMELLDGPTLEQSLRESAKAGLVLTEAQALDIGIAVLRSLHEAHQKGLVHRDLKPTNIILARGEDNESVVKVLDFGIARTQDSSLTGGGKALGTPSYMSPEQCESGAIDGRSDLYALGVILWRCVTGQPLYVDDSPLRLMYMHRYEPVPDVCTLAQTPLSDGFVLCLYKLLAKSPDDRYQDARTLRCHLEALRGGSWAATPMPALDAARLARADDAVTAMFDTPLRRPSGNLAPQRLPSSQIMPRRQPSARQAVSPLAPEPEAAAQPAARWRAPVLIGTAIVAVASGVAWGLLRGAAEPAEATAPAAAARRPAPEPAPSAPQIPAPAVAAPVAASVAAPLATAIAMPAVVVDPAPAAAAAGQDKAATRKAQPPAIKKKAKKAIDKGAGRVNPRTID